MKILFAGCSIVYGAEIEREQRFSRLVCDALGAEEYNIAYGGRGSDMSAVLAITESERIQPDYIVFGLTFLHRTVGLVEPDTPLDNVYLGEWLDDTYHDNHRVAFQINTHMVDPGVPMRKEIEAMVPTFRNDLAAYVDLVGIIALLDNYSKKSGIPMCIFPAVELEEWSPKKLNGINLSGTSLEFPPKSQSWFNECLTRYKRNIDSMPDGHPGPESNRLFADKLIERIRQDLKL